MLSVNKKRILLILKLKLQLLITRKREWGEMCQTVWHFADFEQKKQKHRETKNRNRNRNRKTGTCQKSSSARNQNCWWWNTKTAKLWNISDCSTFTFWVWVWNWRKSEEQKSRLFLSLPHPPLNHTQVTCKKVYCSNSEGEMITNTKWNNFKLSIQKVEVYGLE